MNWKIQPLGSVADLCLGKMLDQKKNKGVPRPYLANINVRWGSFDLNDLREMRFEDKELDRYGLRDGDIVMCEGGEPGRCAIWRDQLPGMMYQKALHRIRPHPSTDTAYLYYALLLKGRSGGMDSYFTGATIKHLPGEQLAKIQVALPPLETQRRIAGILRAYDDLIEVNRRRIVVLEKMARGLFTEWFIRLRFPGHENVAIEDTPDGPLPAGWQRKPIGETFDLLGGGTPSKAVESYWQGGSIDWFTPTDLTGAKTLFMDQSSARITEEGLAKSSAKLFPSDSIMMTSRATIGVISICTGPACTNQGFITCLPNDDVPRSYLYYWLTQNVPLFIAHATGATFKEITKGVFKRLPILVPDRTIIKKFETFVRPLLDKIRTAERSNRNLTAARDLLLPRLISGQLSVTQAEQKLEAA